MKQTVIMSPYKTGFSGMAEFKDGFLAITLNRAEPADEDVFKVYLLSTSRAMAEPYFAGDFESRGHSAEINISVREDELIRHGYNFENIDTCVITLCNGDKEEPVSAAFFGLEWNAPRFLSKKSCNPNETADEIYCDTTLSDAQKLMNDMKKGKETDETTLNPCAGRQHNA